MQISMKNQLKEIRNCFDEIMEPLFWVLGTIEIGGWPFVSFSVLMVKLTVSSRNITTQFQNYSNKTRLDCFNVA